MSTGARILFLVGLAGISTSCSVRSEALRSLGGGLSTAFSTDDDPELVGDALPAALKTIEGLLEAAPRDRSLLLAACSGFARYAYGWVQQAADFAEASSLAVATEQRARARRLHLRARDYGLRGLELDLPGIRDRLRQDPAGALAAARTTHVPLLYWTAVAWASA